jgi:chromate transporter
VALRARLVEVAAVFSRLGATVFGGPAVHIAVMEEEVVRRRGWIDRDTFFDLVGASNLLPGPNSTEMALHLGYQRGGLPGLCIAGVSFIAPPALMTAALAALYVKWGSLQVARNLLYGLAPVVLAVVFLALIRLVPATAKSLTERAVLAGAAAASLAGVHELLTLLAGGLVVSIPATARRLARLRGVAGAVLPVAVAAVATAASTEAGRMVTTSGILLFFLKVGSVLYGSGYVLLAFLRAELVERHGWLTDTQLIDAIAVGQFTPGPLFTTATFVGYLLDGWRGAAVATFGIFAPAFLFVALSGPLVRAIRKSAIASALLAGVTAASVGLMAAVWLQLAASVIVDVPTALLAAAAFLALRYGLSPGWCLAAGAALGLLRALAR